LSNELKASLVFLGIADAREAIAGDTQLSRRLDQKALPRWKADDEFQCLVVAILRSLPLRRPLLAAARIRAYSAALAVLAKEHSLQERAQCRHAPISPDDSGGTIDLCKRWPLATASGGLRR